MDNLAMATVMPYQLITATNIIKTYEFGTRTVHALRGVSLQIAAGEFLAIMGPSGSGKSTLMSVLGLLDHPTSGRYLLEGVEVSTSDFDLRALLRRKRIGFVFQSFSLLGRSTALENVALPLVYAGVNELERLRRARLALARVGLSERAEHWPSQLSGGEQQRVAIARALVNDPALILADEPTGALDTKTGGQIMAQLQSLHDEGRTIVIITHDSHVASYASRVIRMQDGLILDDSSQQPNSHGDCTQLSLPVSLLSART